MIRSLLAYDIVVIGDAHLCATHPRNADRLSAIDQIVAEGLARPRLAAWFLPGDVFHSRSTPQDRNDVATRLVRMAHAAPVLICYGNHDQPGDLDIFAQLGTTWPIRVVARPQVVTLALGTDVQASVAVMPYPTKGGLIAAGTTAGQTLESAHDALDAILLELRAQLDEAADVGDLTCFVAHVNVGGARVSTGQPNIGREVELTSAQLDALGPHCKVANHIHLPQTIHGLWYPGSICRLNYGEREDKRYLILTFERRPDGAWSHTVTSQPIACAPRYDVEGDLTRDGFTWALVPDPGGVSQPPPATWAGAEIRVRFRYRASERDVLDVDQVRAPFIDAADLKLDPVVLPDRALRAPQVAAARTLTDKLRAWAEQEGATLTDGVLEKLARLEQGQAEQVLTELAIRLAELDDADVQPATPAEQAVSL